VENKDLQDDKENMKQDQLQNEEEQMLMKAP
jgi:hypothetical protein